MLDATEQKLATLYVGLQNMQAQLEECLDEIAAKADVKREKHVRAPRIPDWLAKEGLKK